MKAGLFFCAKREAGARAFNSRFAIPAHDVFCWRRPLLGLDPFGLLGEPEPFAHKVVIARPKIRAARFMSFLQRQRAGRDTTALSTACRSNTQEPKRDSQAPRLSVKISRL